MSSMAEKPTIDSNMRNKQIIFLSILLFMMLSSIYVATYWGLRLSNDERYLFDSTESLVRRGDFKLTYTYDIRATGGRILDDPWPEPAQEPLMPILVAPLFYLAQSVPTIGLMHTVWLFNIGVTVATAVLIFYGGIIMGYRVQSSWIIAFLFGISTLALPYARTFFREPLVGFLLLAAYLSLYYFRQHLSTQHIPWKTGIVFFLCFIAMIFTKVSSLLFLPGLLFILLPSRTTLDNHRRNILLATGISGIILILIIVLMQMVDLGSNRFSVETWREYTKDSTLNYVWQSTIGYHISPGRSFWLYSPILLLIFPSIWLSRKSEQGWRIGVGVLISSIILGISYGILQQNEWWGGLAWGPRHFLPLVSIATLLCLPIIDGFFTFKRFQQIAIISLIGLSILIQFISIGIPVPNYYADAANISAYDLNWSIKWSPIVRHIELMDVKSPAVAWSYANDNSTIALIFIAFTLIISAWGSFIVLRKPSRAQNLIFDALSIGLLIPLGLGTVIGIYSLKEDPRYFEYIDENDKTALLELIDQLNTTVQPDEVVVIEELRYQQAFMNYFKVPTLTVTMPFAPGETFNPELAASLADRPYHEQLPGTVTSALVWVADNYETIWLVVGKSPAMNLLRPTEHFMIENDYPVETLQINDHVRAVAIYTSEEKPNLLSTSLNFGENLILKTVDLPEGTTYSPGDTAPVSLFWEVEQSLGTDYGISVQIFDVASNSLIAQHDGVQGTFGATSRWEPDHEYQDNHGLRIPNDTPRGEYRLQVIVYTYPDISRLPVTSEGNPEPDIAIITPITIE